MSTVHLNDSQVNSSLHTKCILQQDDTHAGLSITSIILISNFVVGFPANIWVVWLICHGTKEVLASDIFLLSLAVCETLNYLGLPAQLYCIFSFERVSDNFALLLAVLWILGWVGRPVFQSCICVERYIAVVHPLIFIRLKPLKYRVAHCALAWCAFFVIVLIMWTSPTANKVALIWFIPTLCLLLFCYFSVLCSLKRPGPGRREGDKRKRGDKMKGKAFNIILVHLACFLVNYLPILIVSHLQKLFYIPGIAIDLMVSPGSLCGLVQPLLYLHRAGKLSCVRQHRPEG